MCEMNLTPLALRLDSQNIFETDKIHSKSIVQYHPFISMGKAIENPIRRCIEKSLYTPSYPQ